MSPNKLVSRQNISFGDKKRRELSHEQITGSFLLGNYFTSTKNLDALLPKQPTFLTFLYRRYKSFLPVEVEVVSIDELLERKLD